MDLSDITLLDIVSSSVILANKGRRLSVVNRPTYALHFCTLGKITYTHKGQKYVADPDHAMILPMNATYELYNNEGGQFPLINFLCAEDTLPREFISYPIRSVASYLEDFEKIRTLPDIKENRLLKLSLLYKIFNQISYESNKGVQILAPAVKYMTTHLSEAGITNDILAKEAHISEIYLRTLFRECYHTSPHQYLISLRMERAKQLLLETDDTIQNIAFASGFSSIYHFTRAFKKNTAMNPTEYRKVFPNRFS